MALLTDKAILTTPALEDFIHVVDVSDLTDTAAGTSKKTNWDFVENLFNNYSALVGVNTVTSDTSYNAFPGIAKTDDGNLIIVYRKGPAHATGKGTIKSKISTDGGKTWGVEATVFSDATLDSRDPSITLLKNGNLIISFFKYDSSTAPTNVFTTISTDNGATWGTPVNVGGYATWGACSGPIIELLNGNLLLPSYGLDPGNACKIHTSTDGGATWTVLSTLLTGGGGSEPNIILLTNGSILATIRDANVEGQVAVSTSTDSGSTWSSKTTVFAGASRAAIAQLTDGTIITSFRIWNPPSTGQMGMRMSSDNGVTWSEEVSTAVTSASTVMEYSALVKLSDSLLGMVFCFQSSTSVSSCYFKYVNSKILMGRIIGLNVEGLVSTGDVILNGSNLIFENTTGHNICTKDTNTGTDKIQIQCGYVSAAYGGGLSLYGNAHATHPGDVAIGLSANEGAKFRVNTSGIDGGTDLFTLLGTGQIGVGIAPNTDYKLTMDSGILLTNAAGPGLSMIGINQNAAVAVILSTGNNPQTRWYFGANASTVNGEFSIFDMDGGGPRTISILRGGTTIGICTNTPNVNAVLDIFSTTKAFMPPRMTTTQKNAIASPTAGMMVYDASLNKLCVYGASSWETVTSV